MIWAHYDRKSETGQSLSEHLKQVGQKMGKGLETVSFPDYALSDEIWTKTGTFHDMGKITSWFQYYLCTGKIIFEKSHSVLSAAMYVQDCLHHKEEISLLVMIAISCHHGSLKSELPTERALDYLEEQYGNCLEQKEKAGELAEYIAEGFMKKEFSTYWRRQLKRLRKEKNPVYFFALQLLYSKLLAADKQDSAGVAGIGDRSFSGDADAYLAQKTKGNQASVNDDRKKIRDSVLNQVAALGEEQLRTQKIFTLTAPTGTGKTLTSISAAMELGKRLEQIYGVRPHIITAVPFLNILEQTIEDYRGIFGDVLVHSSAASPVGSVQESDGGSKLSLQKKMLLTLSWEAPVVLTTFVQLFESILSDENNKLIKINRLTNAIVILDEIQALEPEKYPLYAVILDMLAKHYGTRFILMTATQPKLFSCVSIYGYQAQSTMELLTDYKSYFGRLCRTELITITDAVNDFETLCDFIEEKQLSDKNVLIVVNKIADSIELYRKLEDCGYEVMYLSTNLTGRDRKQVIQQAKNRLNNPQAAPFFMVSTQTIEAGVDLDFDLAFRDLAPMEAIIQTAGRVNRSGNKGIYCPIYVFDTGSSRQIYSTMAVQETRCILEKGRIPESEYQRVSDQYYNCMLTNEKISFDREIYEKGILELDYEEIKKFNMIQNENRFSVIFLQDEYAEELINQLCKLITADESTYETKIQIQQTLNEINRYTVDIFEGKLKKNLPMRFADYSKEICGRRIELNYFIVTPDDLPGYYDATGFIAKERDMFLY